MKINVTKIGAARSQLVETINLFFEERDPVSIHTLVGASLQILNDHIKDIGEVWDNNLIFHYNTIYIKDEYRKLWINKVNEIRNFFKHADKDIKEGKLSIEFKTTLNEFHIFEAIRCLELVEGNEHVSSIEFKVFVVWFFSKHPNLFKPIECDFLQNITLPKFLSVDQLKDWKELLHALKSLKHNF